MTGELRQRSLGLTGPGGRTGAARGGQGRCRDREKQDLGTSFIGVQGGPLWGPGIRWGRSVQTIDWGFVQLLGVSSQGTRRGHGRGRGSGQELLGFRSLRLSSRPCAHKGPVSPPAPGPQPHRTAPRQRHMQPFSSALHHLPGDKQKDLPAPDKAEGAAKKSLFKKANKHRSVLSCFS